MTKAYNEKAIDRLMRLKFTSSLSDKDLITTFNLGSTRLTKWKKEFDTTKITDKDCIYGALRSKSGLKTIDELIGYIDFKNRERLTEKVVQRGLDKLIAEGHAYRHQDKWNYTRRLIEVYSNKTDKLVTEVELGYFDLKKFKKIFKPKAWDYLMYEGHFISKEKERYFEGIVLIDFDFNKFTYDMTCRQGE